MILIAGEKLKKKDSLTIDRYNKAVKLKIGTIYIGKAPKDIGIGEQFEVINKVERK